MILQHVSQHLSRERKKKVNFLGQLELIRQNTSGKMSVETHLETYPLKHTCVAQKVFKYCQNVKDVFAFRFIYNLHVIGILMLPHLVRSGGHCYPPTRIPQDQSCSSVTLRGPPLYFEDQDKCHRIYDIDLLVSKQPEKIMK